MSLEEIKKTGEWLGAVYHAPDQPKGPCDFLVWAPNAERVDLCLAAPQKRRHAMQVREAGYFSLNLEEVAAQALYHFALFPGHRAASGETALKRADPASRLQPRGIHGPSRIVADTFAWDDAGWSGPPLKDYIIYELHVGTATSEGTFDALIPLLPVLCDLGVTALELMPVAEFPGRRNWGYDGVFPFAAHHAYGGPEGLKRLVNACHGHGLAVVMDVVYNHLGPEGNYLGDFGPYFTNVYNTPWGSAVNLDGPHSDQVRRYFLENARYWLADCHVDALRVDAVHGIYDFSARPFLAELTQLVRDEAARQQRRIHCVAESDLNDTKVIRSTETGGLAFDAQWNDDFHHALHSLLTGEKKGYYADFGTLDDLAKAWRQGYVYDGRYSVARQRRHGNDPRHQPPGKFIVFSQNHDQVGNRMRGDRLGSLVNLEQTKLAAASVLLSPYIPLLFMGEEYGEPAPFAYFISHTDPDLVEAVRNGRRNEFRGFAWEGEPPDPQAEATFRQCILTPGLREQWGPHADLYAFYRKLIRLRKDLPALACLQRDGMTVKMVDPYGLLGVGRRHDECEVYMLFHFSPQPLDRGAILPPGVWRKRLDSAQRRWSGPGSTLPGIVRDETGTALSLLPWHMVLWERNGAKRTPVPGKPERIIEGDQS